MTYEEHIQAAEQGLELARGQAVDLEKAAPCMNLDELADSAMLVLATLAEAQVHATLAVAKR